MEQDLSSRDFSFEYNLAKDVEVLLKFNIAVDGVINHFKFQGDRLTDKTIEYFQLISKLVTGLHIAEIPTLSMVDIVEIADKESWDRAAENGDLPILSVELTAAQQAVVSYLGQKSVEDFSTRAIVCFCFSVAKEEVLLYLSEHPQAKLLDLTNEFNIAGACQNCINRVGEIISTYRKEQADYSKVDRQMVYNQLLCWPEMEPYFKMKLLALDSLVGDQLTFRVANPEKFASFSPKIQEYLLGETGYLFEILFV